MTQTIDHEMKHLCMQLLRADTEERVISLLEKYEYWNNSEAWRPFGDRKDNFSTIGNQSSSADAALVEKLVNSVDAVLMGECWSAGIKPNSAEAPRSIPEAVAQFFYGDRSKASTLGNVAHWDNRTRRLHSQRITLAVTGSRRNPSITVVDDGEGQTPQSMPKTLLSIDKQNKVDVHFVQGKFSMGGTGALRFCGPQGAHNLQLIISRRNPKISSMNRTDKLSQQWGFTIVRRENPTEDKKVSTYTYLAPKNIDQRPSQGDILSFDADTLPLFPNGQDAYRRVARWGTTIKLYEYQLAGKSHILRRDGLLYRLDILLPRIALPIRLHECRDFGGHKGSFDTTLNGLGVRLSDDRNDNLEPGFPTSSTFTIRGQEITAEVYAFKRSKADTYRKNEGIIFAVNGQTHGRLQRKFFSRQAVGMNRLEDSILVIVDCSRMNGRAREDLFMNNRERMEQGEFLNQIETELGLIIKNHQLLRDLRERRRREDIASKLEDSKPFKDILESILRSSPSLAALFSGTGTLPNPFNPKPNPDKPFHGEKHPSFFKFKKLDYGRELYRETPINMRSRIAFETDVVNDYFTRGEFSGKRILRSLDNEYRTPPDHSLNLLNGVATLNLKLPDEAVVGASFKYQLAVEDETLIEPFVNSFVVKVKPKQELSPNPNPSIRQKPGSHEGLAIPIPRLVHRAEWGNHSFDKYSALKVIDDKETTGSHTYYINMDNVYLETELKATKESAEIVKSRWKYGMVLIGMALLKGNKEHGKSNGSAGNSNRDEGDDFTSAEDQVRRTTVALAPVLLPLIEHLGALSEEELAKAS